MAPTKPTKKHTFGNPNVAEPIREDLPFTLGEVKAAIPKELFKADMFLSWYYIARDVAAFAVTAFIAYQLLALTDNTYLRAAIWIAHGAIQGTTGFGFWVIGHECGHQAYFGDRFHLNNNVGLIIHSFMITPFHAWKITHATHHRFTNNAEKDTAFVPYDEPSAFWAIGESFPLIHVIPMAIYLLIGFPMYLLLNYEGHDYPQFWSHFNPNAPMFRKQDRTDIIVSDVAWGIMFAILVASAYHFGITPVLLWYFLPLLGVNAWLVCVTFLQHSDVRLGHYHEGDNFEFLKGALAAVDRTYGGPLDNMLHHITNGHVVHHIFSHMPFYHAIKATPYVKKFVGEKYYLCDDRWLPVMFCESWFAHQSSFLRSPKWKKANKVQ